MGDQVNNQCKPPQMNSNVDTEIQDALNSKRKLSQSPINSNKSTKLDTPAKERMAGEALNDLTEKFGRFEDSIAIMMKGNTEILKQNLEIKAHVQAIEQDNKVLIEENAKEIKAIKEYQVQKDRADDIRMSGMEDDIRNIRVLCEQGGTGAQVRGANGYSHESEHERELATSITLSRSCVTMLGAEKTDLNTQEAIAMFTTPGCKYTLPGQPSKYILGVSRMGANAKNPPFKIQLDCPATADSLLDQARAHKRQARENPDAEVTKGFRLVQHFPQAYSSKAREFRQQQAAVYDRGGLAQVEYEGTTLTLKVKAREDGGEWLIMRGCEFRPMAVGRVVPQDGETEGMTTARSLMDKVLDNRKHSASARALYFHTLTPLGTLAEAKKLVGKTLSKDLEELTESDSVGAKLKYIFLYSTREAALSALKSSRLRDLVTAMDKDTDYMQVVCPVVAD